MYKSTSGGAAYYYIHDVQGRTIAMLNGNGSIAMLNLHGLDHLGYIRVTYGALPVEEGTEEHEPEAPVEEPGGEAALARSLSRVWMQGSIISKIIWPARRASPFGGATSKSPSVRYNPTPPKGVRQKGPRRSHQAQDRTADTTT